MVKLTQLGESQYVATIPQELRKAMGWEKGDELDWSVENSDTLKLKKKD
ncbi:MAG: AbrB/MazE/SpoVT family DNA-binding domain-containing protein [Candidatus Nanohaloarchaea archaeon]